MKFFKTVGLACLSIVTTTAIATAAIGSRHWELVHGDANPSTYSCNDIVFNTHVESNIGAYSDITNLASKGVTVLDCSMTSWTNANYTSDMTLSAIKIGGSKADKYVGSVKLTLNQDMTASKLIIYAAGWLNDTNIKLGVNGNYQDLPQTTDTYDFLPYTFDLGGQLNEIILSNNNAGTKSRVVISKIVLRLYNEALASSGDTPVDPPTPTSNIITFNQSELAVSSQTITKDGVTLTNTSTYSGAVTELRVYKNQTLTITATGITKIEFTCTASGTTKYGPGCFADLKGYSYNATIGTWIGSADSVTFTASTNQVRITELIITIGE